MKHWYWKPKRFVGAVELGGSSVEARFSVGITINGDAKISIDPLPEDPTTSFIIEQFYDQKLRFAKFKLSGKARDGTTFSSETVVMHGLKTDDFADTASTIAPTLVCHECLIVTRAEPRAAPAIKVLLRGFSSINALSARSPLGTVEMMGARFEESERLQMTGALTIQAEEMPVDFDAWRTGVEGLVRHVRAIMSFARGARLTAPVVETLHDGRAEVIVRPRSNDGGHGMGPFPPEGYEKIFRLAVASHFHEAPRFKDIDIAIEWFTMPNGYREGMLMTAMTVLENLLTCNLSRAEVQFRNKNQFSKMRQALLAAAQAKLKESGMDEPAVKGELDGMADKLEDLNRRPLKDKLLLLAKRWNVPMDGVSEDALAAAKRARDHIVHRGRYEPPAGSESDLIDHVRLARELVVRFVLAALEFDGTYASPLTGERARQFRPSVPGSTAVHMS